MTTHIKNAEYRRFWEARYSYWIAYTTDHPVTYMGKPLSPEKRASGQADIDAAEWADRFADPETLADIEANEMKRGQG